MPIHRICDVIRTIIHFLELLAISSIHDLAALRKCQRGDDHNGILILHMFVYYYYYKYIFARAIREQKVIFLAYRSLSWPIFVHRCPTVDLYLSYQFLI